MQFLRALKLKEATEHLCQQDRRGPRRQDLNLRDTLLSLTKFDIASFSFSYMLSAENQTSTKKEQPLVHVCTHTRHAFAQVWSCSKTSFLHPFDH